MKTTTVLFASRHMIFFVLMCSAFLSNAQINSDKVYGTSYEDVINRIDRCADGGYYISGSRNLRSDGFLIRADSLGNIVWDKIVDFDSSYVLYVGGGMLDDESYVLIFEESPSIFQPILVTLIRFNTAGDTLWSSVICCTHICCAEDPIIPLENGEFLLAGIHQNLVGQPWAGNIFKIDSTGNMLFQTQFYPESLEVQLVDYKVTPQNEIVVVGMLNESPHTHPVHGFLMKFDLDGNFISQELYKDSTNMGILRIFPDTNNTYTLLSPEQTILMTDTNGTILNAVRNVAPSFITDMEKVPGDGYYFQGFDGLSQQVLAKTDFNFDTLWTKMFPGQAVIDNINISSTGNSILLSTGASTINNLFGGFDGEVHNLDSSGNSECLTSQYSNFDFQPVQTNIIAFDSISFSYTGIYPTEVLQHQVTIQSGIFEGVICNPQQVQVLNEKHEIILYPNPVNGKTFRIELENAEDAEITFLSMEGKKISGVQEKKISSSEITIELPSSIADGIYQVVVDNNNFHYQIKVVVMNAW